jgi:hypothetical protein
MRGSTPIVPNNMSVSKNTQLPSLSGQVCPSRLSPPKDLARGSPVALDSAPEPRYPHDGGSHPRVATCSERIGGDAWNGLGADLESRSLSTCRGLLRVKQLQCGVVSR